MTSSFEQLELNESSGILGFEMRSLSGVGFENVRRGRVGRRVRSFVSDVGDLVSK